MRRERRKIDRGGSARDEICDDMCGAGSEQDAVAMMSGGEEVRSVSIVSADLADEGESVGGAGAETGPAFDLGCIGCGRPKRGGAAAQEREGGGLDQFGVAGIFDGGADDDAAVRLRADREG